MILKNKKDTKMQLLLLLMFLYPVSGAVVTEGPFTSRAIIGAPIAAVIIGLGIVSSVSYFSSINTRRITTIIITVFITGNFLMFIHYYFFLYPLHSSDYWGWQYGPKEIVRYFEVHKREYDEMYMIGEFNAPEIFFKFYAPHSCEKCRIGVPHESYTSLKKQLFAVTPAYLRKHSEISLATKKTVYYPNLSVAFQIGEIVE